ncbi:hypothetical protein IWC96_00485 [Brevundimonas sp. BAL450]|uniref:hypothetical protein n=1 Tax=Brevundimonas sp. BAL450 TaxID=1708162 RepID=UPI0018C9872A|nr:hypothetical protein [Brevundimonas sp. BAL450]MBG7613755.1 hypothetical protein [Brevundimonas sp. BAL450]
MLRTSIENSGHDPLIAKAILSWTDAKFAAENASLLQADERIARSTWDGGLANPAGPIQFSQTTYRADPSNTIDGCPSNIYDCYTTGQGCGVETNDCQTFGCPDPNLTTDWGGCLPATWGPNCQTQNSLCDVQLPSNP